MSYNCLSFIKNNNNKMRLGRLICSFILLISLVLYSEQVFAQNDNSGAISAENNKTTPEESIIVKTSDLDGDALNDVSFENKNIRLVISSKTGTISSYYLKGDKYEEYLYPPEIVNLGYKIEKDYEKVFSIDNPEKTFSSTNYNVEVESQTDDQVVVKVTANLPIVVDNNTPDNKSVSLIRRFLFSKEGYNFTIENIVSNLKERLITIGNDKEGSLTMSFGPGVFMEPYGLTSLIGLKANGESDIYSKVSSLNDKGYKAGYYCGVGIKDQYFCIMMESDPALQMKITGIASHTRNIDERKRVMDTRLLQCNLPKLNLGAKESRTISFKIYAGPIILDELQKINRTKVADYGWLVTKMLELLRFFYSIFPNYGIAIILLTLLVRLILYPLTLKQTKEMAKMQKLQPKLKDLQDRYKDNPQKMNEEVLKLYTKNKVNPIGGCFPILLQLPIIMALFNTFRNAVELRKASFLWMSDLSKGDPYMILPIAIAALMYYQQGKSNIDPQQRQAMAFMPMMMLFITFSLPSGLLVYWFASSVLGILQQLQANHYMASIKEEN